MSTVDEKLIKEAAKQCHNANKAYCESIGDDSQVTWSKAKKWQKDSAIAGVTAIAENPNRRPEESHEGWLAQKEIDGWIWGEEKDEKEKTHPCMVPYEELPEEQKEKDRIFVETALSVLFPESEPEKVEKSTFDDFDEWYAENEKRLVNSGRNPRRIASIAAEANGKEFSGLNVELKGNRKERTRIAAEAGWFSK